MDRYEKIKLSGLEYKYNELKEFRCELGFAEQGVVFQHELEHQRGILISDAGKEMFIW
jgi:peptide deformylase